MHHKPFPTLLLNLLLPAFTLALPQYPEAVPFKTVSNTILYEHMVYTTVPCPSGSSPGTLSTLTSYNGTTTFNVPSTLAHVAASQVTAHPASASPVAAAETVSSHGSPSQADPSQAAPVHASKPTGISGAFATISGTSSPPKPLSQAPSIHASITVSARSTKTVINTILTTVPHPSSPSPKAPNPSSPSPNPPATSHSAPAVNQPSAASQAPAASHPPAASQPPVVSHTQAASQALAVGPAPAVTHIPVASQPPAVSHTPVASQPPVISHTPAVSPAPTISHPPAIPHTSPVSPPPAIPQTQPLPLPEPSSYLISLSGHATTEPWPQNPTLQPNPQAQPIIHTLPTVQTTVDAMYGGPHGVSASVASVSIVQATQAAQPQPQVAGGGTLGSSVAGLIGGGQGQGQGEGVGIHAITFKEGGRRRWGCCRGLFDEERCGISARFEEVGVKILVSAVVQVGEEDEEVDAIMPATKLTSILALAAALPFSLARPKPQEYQVGNVLVVLSTVSPPSSNQPITETMIYPVMAVPTGATSAAGAAAATTAPASSAAAATTQAVEASAAAVSTPAVAPSAAAATTVAVEASAAAATTQAPVSSPVAAITQAPASSAAAATTEAAQAAGAAATTQAVEASAAAATTQAPVSLAVAATTDALVSSATPATSQVLISSASPATTQAQASSASAATTQASASSAAPATTQSPTSLAAAATTGADDVSGAAASIESTAASNGAAALAGFSSSAAAASRVASASSAATISSTSTASAATTTSGSATTLMSATSSGSTVSSSIASTATTATTTSSPQPTATSNITGWGLSYINPWPVGDDFNTSISIPLTIWTYDSQNCVGEGNMTTIVNWGTNVVTPAASYKLGRGLGEDEALEFFTFKADHTVDIPIGAADPNNQARPECAQPVEQTNPMMLAGSPPVKTTLSQGQCYGFLGNGTQQCLQYRHEAS
ncbi:MAG: hypothetical protein OHK93_008375 [Ramalina farinacea]|uniref:Uncharacterized protein n=1 Tax=Ramalina farinacea TaxID=258253 RepID=A0AA43QNG8_9LECA|nr:hypothetical protein [Ramalina farinacea]